MHAVLADIVATHRQEGTEPDVQGQRANLHPFILKALQYLRRKMKPCGRSGHRPGLAGKDGLVTFLVEGAVVAADIGRQRHPADLLDLL